jgi:uncharacterized protein DUF1298/wax ester synthase-like acyl-CoA acyltransferase family protein
MGVGGVLVFAAGPGLEHARVLERVEQRLYLIPRHRQRLQSPAPAVTNPVWVDDEQFDLGWHVRRAALPAPGGPDKPAELVGHELSRRSQRALAAIDPRRASRPAPGSSPTWGAVAVVEPPRPEPPRVRPGNRTLSGAVRPHRCPAGQPPSMPWPRSAARRRRTAARAPSCRRSGAGVRAFNLVVSNVPGPQQPFWLDGQRLLEAYPAVPLNPANQGLTIGVLSYDGGVHFGLLAARDLDPPLGAMTAAIEEAIAELLDMFAPPARG